MLRVERGHPEYNKLQMCECKKAEIAAREARRRAERLASMRESMGDLGGATFDTFDLRRPLHPLEFQRATYSVADQRRALAAAKRAAEVFAEQLRGWLYLHGPVGGGKSHLLAAIVNEAGERGVHVSYATAPAVLNYVQAGFRDRGNSAQDRLADLQRAELLALDDLGTEQLSDWRVATLYEMLSVRFAERLPTIITSNYSPDGLARRARRLADADEVTPFDRLTDRIAEVATVIFLPAYSMRQLRAEQTARAAAAAS